jgi:hypothetical protein
VQRAEGKKHHGTTELQRGRAQLSAERKDFEQKVTKATKDFAGGESQKMKNYGSSTFIVGSKMSA